MELSCEDKVHVYTGYVRHALGQLRGLEGRVGELVSLAEAYLRDAEYYLGRGDTCTALACISYAEGLLDALRRMGLASFTWPEPVLEPRKRVLVGGVFDILHPGHIYFLRKAAELGDVYVVVARDATVTEKKGRPPLLDENSRVEVLRAVRWVKEAFLGDEPPDFRKPLSRVKPHIVFLGPDQVWLKPLVEEAARELGLEVEIRVLGSRKGGYSSTGLRSRLDTPGGSSL